MKSQIKFPLLIYTLWYLIILFFQIFLQPHYKLTAQSVSLYQRLYLSWVTYWDSAHYISIAEKGYTFPQQAFFPLWPLLIKIFSYILGYYNAAFVLTVIFGLSSFVLFYLLASQIIDKREAKYALILFATFPGTIFLHAGYTEGLFLTLTLLSFLLKVKKRLFSSSIVAGFTTMTRLTGVAVSLTFLFLRQSFVKKIILGLISLTGIVIFVIFLQIKFGNGLLLVDAHKAWCQSQGRCGFVFPLIPLLNYGHLVLIGWIRPSLSPTFIDWFFAMFFLIMLIPVFKKLRWSYLVYSLAAVLFPLTSGTTVGMVRYVLVAFPVFFVFPQVIKSKMFFFLICFLLFLLELRFVTLFTNGIWVA